MQSSAKITSKGQITIPLKVRTALGVKEGDKLVFEQNGGEMTVRPQKRESRFAKYAGIGNPGIGKGREAVISYVRSLRDPE
ncbi:MAG TPA: AbrB/MazE/SpoVT family DNA-binding domain-containing protein [Pyrinomonadaceae bacterium]|nr:AbrB/MazE/SpoVT family DNA-binding domain-containing protein [Acidobacteriota bacterium]HQZ98102.1 AbrB/MazE/SpoVT family DNA-binding domain-containing protein [Pyrinomonadaceae bacterium]